jgi:photoactive yellow protein
MSDPAPLAFSDADSYARLDAFDEAELDALDFGVIGFDADTVVRRYNAFERRYAGLASGQVVGQPLFTVVAPCMNNYLVALRFEEAAASGAPLDATIDYVLTLRMLPVKVNLRLLALSGHSLRYLLVSKRQK